MYGARPAQSYQNFADDRNYVAQIDLTSYARGVTDAPLVEARRLTKVYGEFWAVDGIDSELRKG